MLEWLIISTYLLLLAIGIQNYGAGKYETQHMQSSKKKIIVFTKE